MDTAIRIANNFRRDERGVIAVIFAIVITPALALAGAALDYGKAVQAKTQLQRAVDSAALAAAQLPNATQAEKIAIATDFFWANDAANPFGVLGVPVLTVSYVGDKLTVDSRAQVNTSFMKLAAVDTMEVHAKSTVQAITQSTPGETKQACVLVTHASTDRAIKMNGGSKVNAHCGVYVNSTSSDALHANHDTTLEADFTCIVGSYHTEDGQHFNPTPTTGCAPMQDPFVTLVAPSNAAAKCTNPKNTQTLYTPGVYCGINISSNSTVNFDPGVYVINKGQFNIGSGATVRITPGKENTGIGGVFFYLVGNNSTFKFGSSAVSDVPAPRFGCSRTVA